MTVYKFPHNDPPGDHRQVGCQRALAAKMAENRHIVLDDRQENLRRQILAIGRRQVDRPALGRVVNNVDH
jgi:hypothetical protein